MKHKIFIKRKSQGKTTLIKRKWIVYSLVNCETLQIFYIGYTGDMWNRFRHHKKHPQSQSSTKLKEYLLKLDIMNVDYTFKILKEFKSKEDAKSMEKKLITHCKPICNIQHNN